MKKQGVLVGSDQTQEWLLPWWWDHFQKNNSIPVAFVDFGLSFAMKKWCSERGRLIPLPISSDFVKQKNEMSSEFICYLEQEFASSVWTSRQVWFKKPLACLKSPFFYTLWIDLDCEIRKSLAPLFSYAEKGIAMAKDPHDKTLPFPVYNSGVIAFSKEHPIMQKWAAAALTENGSFRGDQELLSYLIFQNKASIQMLPSIYNWSRCQPEDEKVAILHWHGEYGRSVIKHALWCKNLVY